MSWPFVGRTDQVARIIAAMHGKAAGPVVVTGERGIGRSAVLTRAIETSTVDRQLLVLTPNGRTPFAALAPFTHSAPDGPLATRVDAIVAELERLAPMVVVADDAHLADAASMLVLRTLSRRGSAQLIITRPSELETCQLPDPTECLRYERDTVTLRLPPLELSDVAELLADTVGGPVHPATSAAVHSASGGSPRALRELVVDGGLLDCLTDTAVGWRFREPDAAAAGSVSLPDAAADRLVAATVGAWHGLELDHAEELCRLAAWRGLGDRVAPIWAPVLLLHGHPKQCLHMLDSIPDAEPRLALVRAAALALGLHQPGAASEYLNAVACSVPELRHRAPAYRAWLLAIAGHRVEVPETGGDREASVFCNAARATLALTSGRAAEAVGQLRRALAAAEGLRNELPWLHPFLMACLIDALLLAGRIKEATETAAEFHPGKEISVVISALASQTLAALTVRAAAEGRAPA